MNGLTTGTVARQAGVNIETLRYYERRGLLQKPPRTRSNYRLYGDQTVRRVRFVKRAQQLGFTLAEIKELLSLQAKPGARCGDVRHKAEIKMRDIESKVRSLNKMKRALSKLVAECSGYRPVTECPILEALDEDKR